ncbi:ATP-binding protein [Desulfococcaceae bacterium HSG8]|nr:ATP-binding protein [Desulfococcaceae bacterium HSG8]
MFTGRKEELRHLQNIIKSEKFLICVIYGRRRIGKSELIKKAFEKEKVLIFEVIPYQRRFMTLILLFSPSTKPLVCRLTK